MIKINILDEKGDYNNFNVGLSINNGSKVRNTLGVEKDSVGSKSRSQSQEDDLFSLTELLKKNANHIDNIE